MPNSFQQLILPTHAKRKLGGCTILYKIYISPKTFVETKKNFATSQPHPTSEYKSLRQVFFLQVSRGQNITTLQVGITAVNTYHKTRNGKRPERGYISDPGLIIDG